MATSDRAIFRRRRAGSSCPTCQPPYPGPPSVALLFRRRLIRQRFKKLHQVVDVPGPQVASNPVFITRVVGRQHFAQRLRLAMVQVAGQPVEAEQRGRVVARPHLLRGIGIPRTHFVEPKGTLQPAVGVERTGMARGAAQLFALEQSPAALRGAIAAMAHGGRIAVLGIPTEEIAIDFGPVIFNMLTLRGIYGREMYETWYKMTVMLQSGLDIRPVITHRLAYTDYQHAFDIMSKGESAKVVMRWD